MCAAAISRWLTLLYHRVFLLLIVIIRSDKAYNCEDGSRATLQIVQPTGTRTLLQSKTTRTLLLYDNSTYSTAPADEVLWAPSVVDAQTNNHRWASSPIKGHFSSTVCAGSKVSHCPPPQEPAFYPEAHRPCWLAIDRYGEVLWHISSPNLSGCPTPPGSDSGVISSTLLKAASK